MADTVHIDTEGEHPLQRVRWILDSLDDKDSVTHAELHIQFDESERNQGTEADGGTVSRARNVKKSTNQHTVLWLLSECVCKVDDTAVSRSKLVDHEVTDGVQMSTDQLGNAISTLVRKELVESPKTTGGPPPVRKKYGPTDAGQAEIERLGKPPTL